MEYTSTPLMTQSFDEILDALAHVQRRKLLLALLKHNPQDDAPVADAERETASVERVVEMKHVHLPKLEEYGFVDWDPRTHDVVKGRNFDEIRPLLELLAEHEDELPADWV